MLRGGEGGEGLTLTLTKTLEMKLLKGKKTLDIDDFQEYALSLDQCIKMIREAREGEMKLEESDEKKKLLYSLLMANRNSLQENEETEDQSFTKDKNDKNNSKKRKPGKRNPKRDVTGGRVKRTEMESDVDAV